jgi:hypothetical protein
MKNNSDAICSYTVQQVGWAVPPQTLTIQSGAGGTTSPSPGTYTYGKGTGLDIRAVANDRYRLDSWSGDASGDANPLTVTLDRDMTIKANFHRIINPPLNAGAQKVLNRTLAQAQYINIITWAANPANSDLNIVSYTIYQTNGGSRMLIGNVPIGAELKFMHRNVSKDSTCVYEIVAVNNEPREGDPASVTVR